MIYNIHEQITLNAGHLLIETLIFFILFQHSTFHTHALFLSLFTVISFIVFIFAGTGWISNIFCFFIFYEMENTRNTNLSAFICQLIAVMVQTSLDTWQTIKWIYVKLKRCFDKIPIHRSLAFICVSVV